MKSLKYPEWPYVGTPWEWKGFAEKAAEQPKSTLQWIVERPSNLTPEDFAAYNFIHGIDR